MESTPPSLFERLQDPRDQDAKRRLVEYCAPFLFYWANRLGVPRQDVLDLVQEIFVVLLGRLPHFQYDPGRSFRGWLLVTARNTWLKRRTRENLRPGLPPIERAVEEVPAIDEADFQTFVIRRALDIMRAEFQESTWRACWALVVEGKSGQQVAAELNLSVAAVYKAKSNVLRRLREELRRPRGQGARHACSPFLPERGRLDGVRPRPGVGGRRRGARLPPRRVSRLSAGGPDAPRRGHPHRGDAPPGPRRGPPDAVPP